MRTATEIQQIALYENPDHTVHLDVASTVIRSG